jgi:hypothetical protein
MLQLVSSMLLFLRSGLLLLLLLLQVMGKSKVLVKVHPEGKYVVDIDKEIDIAELTPGESKSLCCGLCCRSCRLANMCKVKQVHNNSRCTGVVEGDLASLTAGARKLSRNCAASIRL